MFSPLQSLWLCLLSSTCHVSHPSHFFLIFVQRKICGVYCSNYYANVDSKVANFGKGNSLYLFLYPLIYWLVMYSQWHSVMSLQFSSVVHTRGKPGAIVEIEIICTRKRCLQALNWLQTDTRFNRGSGRGWQPPTNSCNWHAYRKASSPVCSLREWAATGTEIVLTSKHRTTSASTLRRFCYRDECVLVSVLLCLV